MLAMVGQQFTNNEEVCGAVVSVRKNGHRISLWTGSYNDKEKTIKIGCAFSNLEPNLNLSWAFLETRPLAFKLTLILL